MMIDDQFASFSAADEIAHRAQLRPGAGVQPNEHLTVCELLGANVLIDAKNSSLRIDERQILRRALRIDDFHVLTERFENLSHAELAAQCITIGPQMAGEHEA